MAKKQKEFLQELFDSVLQKGRKLKDRECDEETERDESYISGYRNYTTIAQLDLDCFAVEATQVDWRNFSPAADQNGVRFSLRVLKGGKEVFGAKREGASTAEIFGPQERYIGRDQTSAKEWEVHQGKLPKELQTISVPS